MNPKHVIKFVSRGFIAIAPLTFLILLSSCENSSKDKEINRLEAKADSLSEQIAILDSRISELTQTTDLRRGQGGTDACEDVFPEINEIEYIFQETSLSGINKKVYEVNLEEGCNYNLASFSKCCRCACSVDYLIVDGPVSDGDILTVSLEGSSGTNFNDQDMEIIDGKILLSNYGYNQEWEAGMIFTIENPNGNMDRISCKAGGLCVVVAVEGGGN